MVPRKLLKTSPIFRRSAASTRSVCFLSIVFAHKLFYDVGGVVKQHDSLFNMKPRHFSRGFANLQSSFVAFDQGSARFPESCGGVLILQSSIRSFAADHDSYSELPFHLRGEAGRSITHTIDFRLTRVYSGYPACEPAALGCLTSRNFQYSRTANFLAMATLATALPRRNFSRK